MGKGQHSGRRSHEEQRILTAHPCVAILICSRLCLAAPHKNSSYTAAWVPGTTVNVRVIDGQRLSRVDSLNSKIVLSPPKYCGSSYEHFETVLSSLRDFAHAPPSFTFTSGALKCFESQVLPGLSVQVVAPRFPSKPKIMRVPFLLLFFCNQETPKTLKPKP